jgi:hypothetical protein
MKKYSELFIAFDTAKKKHAVAGADVGREGDIRYLGEIDSSSTAIEKVLGKLAQRYTTLRVCYEAGPTGYGLYRQVCALGLYRRRALAHPTEARRADQDQPA